ncbi:hypothetical protein TREMEDRAFT_66530 [Tremella mesenterica DSM 1558]|uniref:uncharacterized protein n=1 Tax=Tremella mesenterica (strain ATCC 24925 / CBS 8224 / DSM 1558 / NBRC 9311 / NRRL Y-6157 / RJB 2259-6 / UBC 559-6) TaxID=578456 RepID=UPI00032C59A1|nr:uncharacterized protein TREMEDRAFT_66530 [Tremella mesenterica DSM 1558]EIW65469.1 hypothetical protein TREMEDRAFT_66530 [Tremella mesenterica DSM 1558]
MTTFDRIGGGGAKKNLQKSDPENIQKKCQGNFALTSTSYSSLTCRSHYFVHHLANYMEHKTRVDSSSLRLGQIGASLAINQGQSEGWHFDCNEDVGTYSVISVFATGGCSSTPERHQGWLVLPQLNVELGMPIGSVVFFQVLWIQPSPTY